VIVAVGRRLISAAGDLNGDMDVGAWIAERPVRESEPAIYLGGRYWDRTSDLLGVN
jgi:hypothetical protein